MHDNFPAEYQPLERTPHVNPVPDENVTSYIKKVDPPSVAALAEHRAPETAVTVFPADAHFMAEVVGDVLPGLSSRLRKVEEPTKLVGMFAIQAEQAMTAAPLDQLRLADDTEPIEAAEAARLALLRDEIAASFASPTPRAEEPAANHTEAENTLESLGRYPTRRYGA